MQLVGQETTNCVYTTFHLLSICCTTMSLSWLPSGMAVTYIVLMVPKLQPLFKRCLSAGSSW